MTKAGAGTRRRWAAAILLLAVVAGVAVVRAAGGRSSGEATSEPERAAGAEETQPIGLAARPADPRKGNGEEAWCAPTPTGPISLEPGAGVVCVVVVGEDFAPVKGVFVDLTVREDENQPWPEMPREVDLRSRRTNAEGRARFDHVPFRVVGVEITPLEGMWSEPARVPVGSPAVTVRLRRLDAVVVTVVDEKGRPLPKVGVQFAAGKSVDDDEANAQEGHPPNRWRWSSDDIANVVGSAGDDGRATLHVPPGIVGGRLIVFAPDDRVPVVLYPWTPIDVTVRLEPALELSGVVEDARGERVTEGVVIYRPSNGRLGRARVEYDGTFDVRRIPPGPVALRHRSEEAPTSENARETVAKAGATDVVVQAELGASLVVHVAGWPREAGGTAVLTPEPRTGAPPKEIRADVEIDGTARFRGLVREAKYFLWIPPSLDALVKTTEQGPVATVVYRTGVQASEEVLEVALAPGRTITAKVALPTLTPGRRTEGGNDGPWWSVRGDIRERGVRLTAALEDGVLRIAGVPDGTWTLRVRGESEVRSADPRADTDSQSWAGEAIVGEAAEPPTIALRAVPRPPPDAEDDH